MLTALGIKRKRQPAVGDFRAYLAKSLLNRASKLVRRWRRTATREVATSETQDAAEPHRSNDETDPTADLLLVRRALSRNAYSFLLRLSKCGGNVSQLARETGLHRNTVALRLSRIRRAMCCIKNWSTEAESPLERHGRTWMPRTHRDRLRQQIIAALAAGESYRQTRNRLGVSQQTITTCRQKFEQHGPEGLTNRSCGRHPSSRHERLESWLRQHGADCPETSPTALAKRFQLHRTTVHRILKNHRA